MGRTKAFIFDGNGATFLVTGLLSFLITVGSLGLAYPYALVLRHRWRARHTFVNGHPLVFRGEPDDLYWQWVKWWLLMVVTLGVYSIWVMPRIQQWVLAHTEFDPAWSTGPAFTYQPVSNNAVRSSNDPRIPSHTFRDPFAPGADQIRFVLVGLAPSEEQWELPEGVYRLGVGDGVDLDVDDPTGTVGDLHAELVVSSSNLAIAAREGNSIFIGGRRVRGRYEEVPAGAEIRLGKLEFAVKQVGREV